MHTKTNKYQRFKRLSVLNHFLNALPLFLLGLFSPLGASDPRCFGVSPVKENLLRCARSEPLGEFAVAGVALDERVKLLLHCFFASLLAFFELLQLLLSHARLLFPVVYFAVLSGL